MYEFEVLPEFEQEYEWEVLPEFESHQEWEVLPEMAHEHELEARLGIDPESEQFFGAIQKGWNWLSQPGSPQRAAALKAARWALNRGGQWVGQKAGGNLADWVGNQVLPQREFEGEFELQTELDPRRRVAMESLMEHLAHEAKDAETEAEAEAFIGALVPLATQLIPRAAPALAKATPNLIRGLAAATRALRATPATRPLVRTLPSALRNTAMLVAQQNPTMPPQQVIQTMARQVYRTTATPQAANRAYKRSQVLDARFHGLSGGRKSPCGCK